MSGLIIPLAISGFLTGSILTLVIPLAFVVVVTLWYLFALRRRSSRER